MLNVCFRYALLLTVLLMPQCVLASNDVGYIEAVDIAGTIVAKDDVIVRSGYFGIISEVYVDKGDIVSKGQPIAKISPVEDYEKLELAKSSYEKAQIFYLRETSNFAKAKDLYLKKLISEQEYMLAKDRKKVAHVDMQQFEKQINMALTGDSTFNDKKNNVVYASIAGTVVDVSVTPGDHILSSLSFSEGSAIARIASMDDMIFVGKVEEGAVSRLSKGNEAQVKVSAYPEASFFGEVDEIALIAERDNGKAYFPLIIRLTSSNGYSLRIGLSAKSKIMFNKRSTLLSKN